MMLALCTMIRNERPYILEWLAFHALAGVAHFRIYDNESDDGTAELLRGVAGHFNIDVIPWPETGFDRQVLAFNDGLLALRDRARFVGFIDADEFLFDRDLRPLPKVLEEVPADVSAIGVNQSVFGSSHLTEASEELVIHRFQHRAADSCAEHRWYKTIVRPEMAMGFETCHSVTLRGGRYVLGDMHPFGHSPEHHGEADRTAADGLALHHYILKSLEEFRRKQRRGANSDRREAHYRRLDDDYFFGRDSYANAIADRSLATLTAAVQARMAAAMAETGSATPAPPPPDGYAVELNTLIPIDQLVPRYGFYDPISGFSWIRSFSEGRFLLLLDGAPVHIALRAFRIARHYPIDRLLLRMNGQIVPIAATVHDDHWFSLQMGPVETHAGTNLLALESPYFVPVPFIDPGSDDARYLSIGIQNLIVLR